jgi:hypothetical protein
MAMEKLTRRLFLRSAAAAPIAAKVVADQAIMDQARISPMPVTRNVPHLSRSLAYGESGAAGSAPAWSGWSQSRRWKALCEFFGGIPEYKLRELKMIADNVENLDVDLSAKKSWSMAAKVHEQRKRNYARQVKMLERAFGAESEIAEEIRKRFGVYF